MSIWLILSLVILVTASVGLLLFAQYQHSADAASQRRFFEIIANQQATETSWNKVMQRMGGQSRLNLIMAKFEQADTVLLLKQAGWYNPTGRVMFYLSILLAPLLFAATAFLYLAASTELSAQVWAQLFIAAVIGFLLPKNIVRRKAKNRRQTISREMPTVVHLLRMLFEAGLSTEHVIRVLHNEAQVLTPEIGKELKGVLRLIDAGMEPSEALSDMAAPLEVTELNDTVAILKQVSRHGGNIRETLVKFAKLMEERQLSALREYVNVLSGKMSLVMMIFLFPALLIFLAGPGFIALGKGLMGAM